MAGTGGNRYTEGVFEWIESLHWAWAILFFWMVGIVRTSIVFMLGWLAASGSRRVSKIEAVMKTPLYLKAQAFVNRWGALAVPMCFVTVGFQTAVIITTGFTHMPLIRWIPAMLVGTLIWGTIYGTIGMTVLWAWLRQPWVVAPLLVLALLVATVFYLRKRVRISKP